MNSKLLLELEEMLVRVWILLFPVVESETALMLEHKWTFITNKIFTRLNSEDHLVKMVMDWHQLMELDRWEDQLTAGSTLINSGNVAIAGHNITNEL